MFQSVDVLIIGSGPAGYTAGIYLSRSGVIPYIWSGLQKGGQLTITSDVENYPGFADPIMGPDLMIAMEQQAQKVGCVILTKTANAVDLSTYPFRVTDDSDETILAKSLIIATGATARWLGLDNEKRLQGRGVSACATCDGFFFRDQTVAVVGGGNSAAEEALFLTKHAKKVLLIHRRDSLRAEHLLSERVFAHPKIEVLWNSKVVDVLGDDAVTGLQLEDSKNGRRKNMDVDGVFVAIGHDPATTLFRGQIDMDEEYYIKKMPHSSHTSKEGVFVAGDATDKVYRQAVTAAGMGCMAAIDAFHFLESRS